VEFGLAIGLFRDRDDRPWWKSWSGCATALRLPSRGLLFTTATSALIAYGIVQPRTPDGLIGPLGWLNFAGGIALLVILGRWRWFLHGRAVVQKRAELDRGFAAWLSVLGRSGPAASSPVSPGSGL